MNKTTKQKQFKAFIEDIAGVMIKHGVKDAVCIFGLNGEIRNTYIPLAGEENRLYCMISDAFNEWMRQGYPEQ